MALPETAKAGLRAMDSVKGLQGLLRRARRSGRLTKM
jgi:hypothetical protein